MCIEITFAIRAVQWEKVFSGMCGQRRPRSACASANGISWCYRLYRWRSYTRMRLCACAGWIWNLCILRMLKDTFSLDAALSLVGSFLILFWQFSDYWWTEVTWVTLKRVVDKIFNRKHEKQNISKYISRKNAIRVNKKGIHDSYM